MRDQERPADRIVRLMREAVERNAPPAGAQPQIMVQGNGNILGNVHGDIVTIHNAPPRTLTRSDRKVIRASACAFIRWACKQLGDPSRYSAFAIDEFGTDDLERLNETQLERVRGWCAAQSRV